jgi:hypothetical protein
MIAVLTVYGKAKIAARYEYAANDIVESVVHVSRRVDDHRRAGHHRADRHRHGPGTDNVEEEGESHVRLSIPSPVSPLTPFAHAA